MMTTLSDQQRILVERTGSFIAHACPGAGKTRAIVQRFLRRSNEEPRRGVALVSFTNAAVDEVRRRCTGDLSVLRAPNFVGTFDSFINRYVTTPQYVRREGRRPHFTEKWNSLPAASFRIWNMGRVGGLELDWFDFDEAGAATLVEERIPRQKFNSLKGVLETRGDEVTTRASQVYRGLLNAGTLSCTASRMLATVWTTQPESRAEIAQLLSARFAEVIVDEAQDCGAEELHLLELLREAGIEVVMVADLDQSIYGFRRAEPANVSAFAATLGAPASLDGNWRSSSQISALNRSLRYQHREDVAVGENKDCDIPIYLLTYGSIGQIAPAVRSIAESHQLSEQEIIVLAHKADDARNAAGAEQARELAAHKVLRIAAARRTLLAPASDARSRLAAISDVERMLLSTVLGSDQTDKAPIPNLCEQLGVTPTWVRSTAIRLITSLDPSSVGPKPFAEEVRQHLRSVRWPGGTKIEFSGKAFAAPPEKDWKDLLVAPIFDALPWGTIHSAKGCEYPGVAVLIPKNLPKDHMDRTVLDHWESDTSAEPRRVLYVGCSRAERLAILACHSNHVSRVKAILMNANVKVQEVTAASMAQI